MKQHLKTFAMIVTITGCMGTGAVTHVQAQPAGDELDVLRKQVQQLLELNKRLSERVTQLEQAAGAGKNGAHVGQVAVSEEPKDADLTGIINRHVSFSGVVEVEASAGDDFDGTDSSGLELATVELAFDARVSRWVGGHVLVLYEEGGDDDVLIDEGYIVLGNREAFPVLAVVGRQIVPFGRFDTGMISDPLTLEIGETHETALLLGVKKNGLQASLFTYNGDTREGDTDDPLEQFGASISYTRETDGFSFDTGISYVNSIGDTDGLTDWLGEQVDMLEYVDGMGIHVGVGIGPFSLIGEYVTALDDFTESGNQPMAFNAEIDYSFDLEGREICLGMAYQGTDDLAGFLPESRILAAMSVGIFANTTLALEYTHDEDYDQDDGGTDASADRVTAQLAYEF